ATVGLVGVLIGTIPHHLERSHYHPSVFRAAAVGCVSILVLSSVGITPKRIGSKTIVVGRGADAFRTDQRGTIVNAALDDVATRVMPNDTLLVVPEGVMLNFLARRDTPTPYVNFMPPEFLIF